MIQPPTVKLPLASAVPPQSSDGSKKKRLIFPTVLVDSGLCRRSSLFLIAKPIGGLGKTFNPVVAHRRCAPMFSDEDAVREGLRVAEDRMLVACLCWLGVRWKHFVTADHYKALKHACRMGILRWRFGQSEAAMPVRGSSDSEQPSLPSWVMDGTALVFMQADGPSRAPRRRFVLFCFSYDSRPLLV